MRASIFFPILREGRKIYHRENSIFLADLCDVAVIAANTDNHKNYKSYFRERAFGPRKTKSMDPKDPKTAHILAAAFWAGRVRE